MTTFESRRPTSLREQLRAAIAASGMTRYRLARLSGVCESSLSRFMAGSGGLSIDSIDRLWMVLGLRISAAPRENDRGNALS
jgi:transcriptional regulator with XRE-family HTH domain